MPKGPQQPQLPPNVVGLPGAQAQGAGVPSGIGPFWNVRRSPEPWARPRTPVHFTVRLDLDGAKPPIWRRLELAGDLTLTELHDVLQVAMGWRDGHLHQFTMGPDTRDLRVEPFHNDLLEDELAGDVAGLREDEVRLDQVVAKVGHRLFYEYDFGDGWEHTLEVQAVRPSVEDDVRARCLAGRRACPPEDSGGIGGYLELVDALRHGTDEPWTAERLAWLPADFDPAAFDLAAADRDVRAVGRGEDPYGVPLDRLAPGLARTLGKMGHDLTLVMLHLTSETLEPVDVDVETAAAITGPWRALLEHIGDGLELTSAGYLRPASVVALVGALDVGPHADIMFGKGNREEHVQPVAHLRASATAMGLVRKRRGVLTVTASGRACLADPRRLLHHMAGRLPLGRADHEVDTGWMAVLLVAAGVEDTYDVLPPLVDRLGWSIDGGSVGHHAIAWARPTVGVLQLAGWNPTGRILGHHPRARLLARLAVTGQQL